MLPREDEALLVEALADKMLRSSQHAWLIVMLVRRRRRRLSCRSASPSSLSSYRCRCSSSFRYPAATPTRRPEPDTHKHTMHNDKNKQTNKQEINACTVTVYTSIIFDYLSLALFVNLSLCFPLAFFPVVGSYLSSRCLLNPVG